MPRKKIPSDGGTEKTREQEPSFSQVSLNGSYINMVINNDLGFWFLKQGYYFVKIKKVNYSRKSSIVFSLFLI